MPLQYITVANVRNIHEARLTFHPHLNIITGPNASGKTSLLEAIHLLGTARSFRATRIRQVIQHSVDRLRVTGAVEDGGHTKQMGLERSTQTTQVHIDGQARRSATDLARHLPLLVIDPDSHSLLVSGPKLRRHFLDWGVFHVKHDFLSLWRRYGRALKQRNAALRQNQPDAAVCAWDDELAQTARQIHSMRIAYLDDLRPLAEDYVGRMFVEETPLETRYVAGWDPEIPLERQLGSALTRDRSLGHTSVGPHLADIHFATAGTAVRHHISRGQQKLLASALRLAQAAQLAHLTGKHSHLLVDDLPSELDVAHRERFIQALIGLDSQLFITATDARLLPLPKTTGAKVFHVERGIITDVV